MLQCDEKKSGAFFYSGVSFQSLTLVLVSIDFERKCFYLFSFLHKLCAGGRGWLRQRRPLLGLFEVWNWQLRWRHLRCNWRLLLRPKPKNYNHPTPSPDHHQGLLFPPSCDRLQSHGGRWEDHSKHATGLRMQPRWSQDLTQHLRADILPWGNTEEERRLCQRWRQDELWNSGEGGQSHCSCSGPILFIVTIVPANCPSNKALFYDCYPICTWGDPLINQTDRVF